MGVSVFYRRPGYPGRPTVLRHTRTRFALNSHNPRGSRRWWKFTGTSALTGALGSRGELELGPGFTSVTVPGEDAPKPQRSVWTPLSLEAVCVHTFSAVRVILLQPMSAARPGPGHVAHPACKT